jgi:serine/threonine protein kinase
MARTQRTNPMDNTEASANTVPAKRLLGGRYRLDGQIGAGGMGTVWEATDNVLGRTVAVKVLSERLSSDEAFAERFRREARAAAGLSHPNVAAVHDYGVDGQTHFIVMERLEGRTLREQIDDGSVDRADAIRIVRETAVALQAAHDAGVVHRDVKPGNIMVDAGGRVKVMDFGIASAAGAGGLTDTREALGTPAYLSPEQARGRRATPASDVYGLGECSSNSSPEGGPSRGNRRSRWHRLTYTTRLHPSRS